MSAEQATILAELAGILRAIKDDVEDDEITMDTTFRDDLELESLDLVALAGRLQSRYGNTVNFAKFLGGLDPEAAMALRVGQLVEYIATSLDEKSDEIGAVSR
jgi:acyl carrier protein